MFFLQLIVVAIISIMLLAVALFILVVVIGLIIIAVLAMNREKFADAVAALINGELNDPV